MNKLVIITKNRQTYFIESLIKEVGEDKVKMFNPWMDLELPAGENYLVRTTGVYGSDLDLMMLQSLPQEKVINPLAALKKFRSKSAQYLWFEELDFPLLHWLPLKGTDLLTIEKFFRLYPNVVVKPLVGQGGWGIEALTWATFKTWWKKRKGRDEDYLIQPLITGARELRYFFIKNTFALTLERKSKTGIAANFKLQGSAFETQLPAELQETIDRLIEKSGALYGAIDLLIDDGTPVILELNTVPGIEQLEKVTGLNVIQKLLSANFFCHKG
jgi:glutathione synthase/RimK-type ligase-like ATP-grasp enzyme